jgi:hypothetical protein
MFAGVLEYIHDLESLIDWLAEHVSVCIASYTYVAPSLRLFGKVRERLVRLYYGYMNNYSEEEFVELFGRAGFVCTACETFKMQRLFRFHKQAIDHR